MHRSIRLACAALIVPAVCFAGGFGGLAPKKDEAPATASAPAAGAVNLGEMGAAATNLILSVDAATGAFINSYIFVFEACGNKAAAEQMKSALEAAKAEKDTTKAAKMRVEAMNKAQPEMDKVNVDAQMNDSAARAGLGKCMLQLGAGLGNDGIAVTQAVALVQSATDAISQIKSNPTAFGGLGAVGQAKDILAAAKFVAQSLPPQLKSIGGTSGKLVAYAKTKAIPEPTEAETKAAADKMNEKE